MTRKKLIAFALEFFKAGLDASEVGMPNFDQLIKTSYYKNKIDAILALQSEQIEKYKELIEVMDKLYEVSCDVFYDLEIDPTGEMGKLYIKIQLLKTELGL
jgi:hypothetical protein